MPINTYSSSYNLTIFVGLLTQVHVLVLQLVGSTGYALVVSGNAIESLLWFPKTSGEVLGSTVQLFSVTGGVWFGGVYQDCTTSDGFINVNIYGDFGVIYIIILFLKQV